MNKLIIVITCAIALAGCSTTQRTPVVVTQQQFVPVGPSKALLNCPDHAAYPNPDTMTNRQLVGVIVNYEDVHGKCRANAKAALNQTAQQEAEIERVNAELRTPAK